MKHIVFLLLVLTVLFSACSTTPPVVPTVPTETSAPATTFPTETTVPTVTTEPTTEPTETTQIETIPTQPEHSELYIPDLPVEDVITYFNEICLDAEFVNGGDPSILQRWEIPIVYIINGEPTDYDLVVLSDFVQWLNTIEGFPGISETTVDAEANLRIYFCPGADFATLMGNNYVGLDGAVEFWYKNNAIYTAKICYRTEMFQITRNSVILEEIYNGLGPVQDTWLREDSICYAGFSEPQQLTKVDELLLKLLYNPMMHPGMNAEECEAVIRQLYY